MRLRMLAIVAAFVMACLMGARCLGAVYLEWANPISGLFNTSGNWSPVGPPVAGESAVFDELGTYTVTFESAVTNSSSNVLNGTVTFALNGHAYTLTTDGLRINGSPGLTGRLTIINGTISGNLAVGELAGDTGFLTVGDDANFDALALGAAIGQSGVGTMTLNNGGRYTGTGALRIGGGIGAGNGNGTLVVTGAGSSLASGQLFVGDSGVGAATFSSGATASTQAIKIGDDAAAVGMLSVTGAGSSLTTNGQRLTVGENGEGDFTVTSGGTVTAGETFLGNLAGSDGRLSVSGGTSSFTSSSGTFTVGSANMSTGSLEISGGGTLNALVSQIASVGGSAGNATVSGAGSTWNATSLAIGGQLGTNGGAGTLSITDGGTVNVSAGTEVRNSAGSLLTIDGGTLTTVGFTSLGTFKFRGGTLHAKGIYNNGAAPAALVIDSAASGDLATLRLSTNAAVQNVTTLTVGSTNQGALVLDGGRAVNTAANNISIGSGALSSGSVSLSGNNTSLTTTGTLAVGGTGNTAGGAGVLNIGAGSSVSTTTLNLFTGGTINLNGGTLNAATLNTSGGSVNFTSGIVFYTGAASLSSNQLDALVGPAHVLGTARRIETGTTLSLISPLTVNGGELISNAAMTNSTTLQLMAGTVASRTTLTNNTGRLIVVSGTGTLDGATGITNNGTLELQNNLIPINGTLTNSGTIRGSGFIANNLTNNAAGQVQITTGHRIEFQGTSNTNSGSISLIGGELVVSGSLTNSASTGLISGRDAILRTGGITNNGSLAFTAGQMDVYGDITNNVGGRITVSGGGTTTFYDDVTIGPGASDVQATAVGGSTSSVVFFGNYNGAVSGGGTAFLEGDHRPGNSPALVSFGGDVAYGGLSRLFVEIGGTSRGNQYDAVDAAGAAQIGGELDVTLLGGFQPNSGDSFEIVNAADGIDGAFAIEELPPLRGGLYFNVEYDDQAITLFTAGVLGDYNRNGKVDAADYTVWRNALNQPSAGLAADGNGDHVITRLDFDVWKSHYGEPFGSGAGSSSDAAAIPESSTIVLIFCAVQSTLAMRRM